MSISTRVYPFVIAAFAALLFAASANAQFNVPGSTDVRERINGVILEGPSGIIPEAGDQIGALFNDQTVGRFVFESGSTTSFSITIFGDEPDTPDLVEGPQFGQAVQFQFFDSSTNNVIPMTPINAGGEASTYIFQGEDLGELGDFPVILPGFDLTPSRELDLRIGQANGGNGGNDGPVADFDVNGDGKVNSRDAAIILSIVTGGGRASADAIQRADVNGDGVVSTSDAVAILKAT